MEIKKLKMGLNHESTFAESRKIPAKKEGIKIDGKYFRNLSLSPGQETDVQK
jgi:hypothetical protein